MKNVEVHADLPWRRGPLRTNQLLTSGQSRPSTAEVPPPARKTAEMVLYEMHSQQLTNFEVV